MVLLNLKPKTENIKLTQTRSQAMADLVKRRGWAKERRAYA